MISEGSCDTESKTESNDCWKLIFVISGINSILKYTKIEGSYFKL